MNTHPFHALEYLHPRSLGRLNFYLAGLVQGRLCVGCMPRLTSRPLTEEELEWARVIKPSYPAWRPPYYSPARGIKSEVGGYPDAMTPFATPYMEPPAAEPEGGEVELIPVGPQD